MCGYAPRDVRVSTAHEQVEKDRVEVQWRAAEVAARQRALAQEVSKK